MKKVVIAGSVKLQREKNLWRKYWENQGCVVIDDPRAIDGERFLQEYPEVHKKFFENIKKTDILFVMNEDKDSISGYIGAETFAEMCFGVAENLINNKDVDIILYQMPSASVQSYEEVSLWLKLGWIRLFEK